MRTNAIFQRKEPRLEPQPCEIEKVISLTDDEFDRFEQNLLENYDFIQESAEDMGIRDGVAHCLLVMGENNNDGILVNSEGSGYARYAAWFPGARQFLIGQSQSRETIQAAPISSPDGAPPSPALLAYGKKMERILDKALAEALEHHDQAAYAFPKDAAHNTYGGSIDPDLFAAMLKERWEVSHVQTVGEKIHITLTPESITAYQRSKLRVLTQEDVDIMCAKHTLWVYGVGGEQADFSNCLLSNLDLRHRPLNGANFTGALLERTNLSSAGVCFCLFRDAKFVDCQMVGISAEESDFRGASFSGCCVRMGHMTHSNFTGAQFQDTDLWMADLQRSCVEHAALPEEETEGVNLKGASDDEESWSNDPILGMGM